MQKPKLKALVSEVLSYYKSNGRAHLPWRHTKDPYAIWVSEVMLQQTQVDRVLPKYNAFLHAFPTVETLASAPLLRVLALWQGLGYNRRAKFLHQAAKNVVTLRRGVFPREAAEIEALPGVGPYTARAVMAFAFDTPEVFVETNIRTVFFTFLYPDPKLQKVSDIELIPLIAEALELAIAKGVTPSKWYAALMDYGAMLKKRGSRLNSTSVHYTKQSKFAGSRRELRGALLRELLKGVSTQKRLSTSVKRPEEEVSQVLCELIDEGLVSKKGMRYFVAS